MLRYIAVLSKEMKLTVVASQQEETNSFKQLFELNRWKETINN